MTLVPAIAAATIAALVASAALSRGRRHRPARPARSVDDASTRRVGSDAVGRTATVDPAALARWADELARSLRHGSTLRNSLTTVLPDDPTITDLSEPVRHHLARGDDVSGACDTWAEVTNGLHVERAGLLTTFATLLAATSTLGGASAAPIDRFAATMRQRVADDLERGANSAQARLSARVLTAVPLAVLALLLSTDPDVRSVATGPVGSIVIAAGILLNAIGAWWMGRIARPGAHR